MEVAFADQWMVNCKGKMGGMAGQECLAVIHQQCCSRCERGEETCHKQC